MKTLVLFTFVAVGFVAPIHAADRSPAGVSKRANIEAQISEATIRGRTQEVAGLQRALEANKSYCTDKLLSAARNKNIKDARSKVEAREKSLLEAERKGDPRKIEAKKAKLESAHNALVEAEKLLP